MKVKCNFIAALFLLVGLAAGTKAVAEEKTKEYHESWAASSVQTLEIKNKFGDVSVINKNGNEVTIDVLITVEAPNEEKANELLEQINVSFDKTGNTISAETHLNRDFKSRQKFSIDYTVNIPADKNLNIINKYGNTFVNELNANGTFDIQYGNFSANKLNSPPNGLVELDLAYGKADVESANNLSITVQYSAINLGQINDLKLESKYTVINLDAAQSVISESKYDTFNLGEIGSLSSTAKYTKIKMDKLSKSLKVEAGYGGVKVNKVDSNFESISITSRYGQIVLGLGNASYSIDATCDYCGISYPENDFTGDRTSENHVRRVKGKVGSGSGGTVYIESRYGEIKLD
ncbi:hypothetical protein [Mariniphaga sediminis]|uniref:hypothetical protein n=1 Tax=Mariniphaga sediminis TaxID=1628158 RepID=UPI003566823C